MTTNYLGECKAEPTLAVVRYPLSEIHGVIILKLEAAFERNSTSPVGLTPMEPGLVLSTHTL